MWRRLRGVAGTALVWAATWTVGYAPFALEQWRPGGWEHPRLPLWVLGAFLLIGTIWGLVSGATFALLLTAAERRNGWERLRNRRVALWGALGGVAPALALGIAIVASSGDHKPWVAVSIFTVVSALLGAGLAMTHVSVARRAPTPAATMREAAT
jgi:MFS family permease